MQEVPVSLYSIISHNIQIIESSNEHLVIIYYKVDSFMMKLNY